MRSRAGIKARGVCWSFASAIADAVKPRGLGCVYNPVQKKSWEDPMIAFGEHSMNRPLFCVLFMIGCLSPSVLAQESWGINEADRVELPGSAHLPAPPGSDIGRTNPNFRIRQMSVVLDCSQPQPAEARPVLPAQPPVGPDSPDPGKQQDCAVRHPELQKSLPAVTSWLRSRGFVIESVRAGHSAIRFSRTVAPVEETFRVEMDTYLVNGRTHHGNIINPSLPRRLSRLVLRVNTLDDFPLANPAVSSTAGNEKVLYSFTGTNGDGVQPVADLIMDNLGNLYGTTPSGGLTSSGICSEFSPPGCGTVFKVDPSGNETVLHSFTGTNGDGTKPVAGLIMDSAGNLYGTTQYGGITSCSSGSFLPQGCGTVFKLDPSGKETVLYSFTLTNGDGASPAASLIMDSAGNLYGTTQFGGITSGNCPNPNTNSAAPPPAGCGTVFKLDPSGNQTVLYSFTLTQGDGAQPTAGVIMDSTGNLYGTTRYGGVTSSSCLIFNTGPPYPPGCGTAFKLDPSGHEVVLHRFAGTNGDGAYPAAGLIMDSAGNLYGTTEFGGITSSVPGPCGGGPPPIGCGTVFKLDPSGKETVLYGFTGANGDGDQPLGGLIMDTAGNLYGTTGGGGSGFGGTVFKLGASGGKTEIYSFTGSPDGNGPAAGLIMDSAGILYGTTYGGGPAGDGTVFSLKPPVDFSFGPGDGGMTSAAISAGQTATYNVQLNPAGGFNGSVSLSCSGAPAQATCLISPASVTISGSSATPFTVTVTTTAGTTMASTAGRGSDSSPSGQPYAFLSACALLAAMTLGTRRAARRACAPIASLVFLTIALVACSGGGGSKGLSGGTPAGTYNLTVTGTSQAISHTQVLTLTVD